MLAVNVFETIQMSRPFELKQHFFHIFFLSVFMHSLEI